MVIITTANSAASASNTCAAGILRSGRNKKDDGKRPLIDHRLSKNRHLYDEFKEHKGGLIWIVNTDVQGLPECSKSLIRILESRLRYKFSKESPADYLKRIFGFANPEVDYYTYASNAYPVHGIGFTMKLSDHLIFTKLIMV